jgi:hypothetical protein
MPQDLVGLRPASAPRTGHVSTTERRRFRRLGPEPEFVLEQPHVAVVVSAVGKTVLRAVGVWVALVVARAAGVAGVVDAARPGRSLWQTAGSKDVGMSRERRYIVTATRTSHGVDNVAHAEVAAEVRSACTARTRHCWRAAEAALDGDEGIATRQKAVADVAVLPDVAFGAAAGARARVTNVRRFACCLSSG